MFYFLLPLIFHLWHGVYPLLCKGAYPQPSVSGRLTRQNTRSSIKCGPCNLLESSWRRSARFLKYHWAYKAKQNPINSHWPWSSKEIKSESHTHEARKIILVTWCTCSSRREHALLLIEQCPWYWEFVHLRRSHLLHTALLYFPPDYGHHQTSVPACRDERCSCLDEAAENMSQPPASLQLHQPTLGHACPTASALSPAASIGQAAG